MERNTPKEKFISRYNKSRMVITISNIMILCAAASLLIRVIIHAFATPFTILSFVHNGSKMAAILLLIALSLMRQEYLMISYHNANHMNQYLSLPLFKDRPIEYEAETVEIIFIIDLLTLHLTTWMLSSFIAIPIVFISIICLLFYHLFFKDYQIKTNN
ncbi:hypothetical protein WR164_15610 [Philodulcilactobacillus myokoensis]|uniref:Uncharacterized protein n=1 Tax=Philodulcilactobacillus myokoensis TaxID=2929573 RepID=A0A9W6B268_9LACO|nr:hypothetical protein [Philodulcilactobacillus myokoensis]GLB47582.1 hypothetical protein WR164_15610 [Philodulcilactobacillus myokoensis]